MKESYESVNGEIKNEIIIEKSRFITSIKHIEREEEAKKYIENIKKENSTANHNCFAYVLGASYEKQKCSDDKEPQGTAGMPILEVIKKSGLTDIIIVVTRYFGGIKLGTGGLTRAYSSSALNALELIKKVKFIFCSEIIIELSYEKYQKFNKFIENKKIEVKQTIFNENISVTLILPKSNEKEYLKLLSDYFSGDLKSEKTAEYFYQEKSR